MTSSRSTGFASSMTETRAESRCPPPLRGPLPRLAGLAVAALVAVVLALRAGAASASLLTALRDPESFDSAILGARSARVLLGAVTGGTLALVGASYQALFRNPLGDPYALGVSGGAALGATSAVLLGAGMIWVPFAAFVGALGAMASVVAVARASGRIGAAGLLLAGMVSNAVTNAALALLRTVVTSVRSQETLSILLGAIGEEPWSRVALVSSLALTGCVGLWAMAKSMNLLAHGAETAASLGVDVSRAERGLFVLSSLVVAAVVSVSGLIPFVGLVVPHYVRAYLGPDHRVLLPGCFFAGAGLMVLADAACRLLFAYIGSEPPVGALTALLGGGFFLVTLRRMRIE